MLSGTSTIACAPGKKTGKNDIKMSNRVFIIRGKNNYKSI